MNKTPLIRGGFNDRLAYTFRGESIAIMAGSMRQEGRHGAAVVTELYFLSQSRERLGLGWVF